MNLATAAEAVVVALAITGDVPAFEEVVRRRQGPTRALLRRLCRDHALADDLAQETFVQAWRALGTLRAPGAFGGWLKRIAVNAWLAHQRRAGAPLVDLDSVADHTPAPDSPLAGRVAVERDLDAALAQLTPAQRVCVVLTYAEGLSQTEVAEATGLPLGTVKSHISRGAAALRDHLSDYSGDGSGGRSDG